MTREGVKTTLTFLQCTVSILCPTYVAPVLLFLYVTVCVSVTVLNLHFLRQIMLFSVPDIYKLYILTWEFS